MEQRNQKKWGLATTGPHLIRRLFWHHWCFDVENKEWFYRRGKPLGAKLKKLTNSTHQWRQVWESNPGHFGGKVMMSPSLRQHCADPASTLLSIDWHRNLHYLPGGKKKWFPRCRWFLNWVNGSLHACHVYSPCADLLDGLTKRFLSKQIRQTCTAFSQS